MISSSTSLTFIDFLTSAATKAVLSSFTKALDLSSSLSPSSSFSYSDAILESLVSYSFSFESSSKNTQTEQDRTE